MERIETWRSVRQDVAGSLAGRQREARVAAHRSEGGHTFALYFSQGTLGLQLHGASMGARITARSDAASWRLGDSPNTT